MTPVEPGRVPRGVVLVEYYFDDELSILFALRPGMDAPALALIDCPLASVRQFVVRHFQGAPAQGDSPGVTTGDRIEQLDEAAFDEFFAPFVEPLVRGLEGAPALVAEGETIWFVPSDALFYVPMHAVRFDGRYLIERNPVCYSPSASIMAFCQRRPRGSCSRALVVGDSLGDLCHARQEAIDVAGLFHTSPIVSAQATKSRVIEEIKQNRESLHMLHFSCHGYFHPSEALQSGVLLAPPNKTRPEGEVLTAEEILGLELNAGVVTLSACDSGINAQLPGDELMGLTRALLFAGSASCVVSLWEVDDLSTGMLMTEFYRYLLGSAGELALDKAQALQKAQNWVRTLPAANLIGLCDARIRDVDMKSDPARALTYRFDRAEIQAAAGDIRAALEALEELDREASGYPVYAVELLRGQISQAITQLRAFRPEELRIDYQMCPFAAIYYWAPFILVGDWH